MKRLLGLLVICLFALLFGGLYYYNRWRSQWALEELKAIYSVTHHQDDTLRIAMIGDSWVELRTDSLNHLFQEKLSEKVDMPVILKTKGKGGEKSRGIYQLMFVEDGYGTKPLLSEGVDYCVVFSGINDAAANLGTKQYLHHMRYIMNFLLANDIRPILIEIPNVNIWSVYGKKALKDLVLDFMRSLMTECGMYHFSEYRDALYSMLKDSGLKDSVLYVPMKGWNGADSEVNCLFFLDDQIHLNQQGYIKMDSCVIDAVCRDLQ